MIFDINQVGGNRVAAANPNFAMLVQDDVTSTEDWASLVSTMEERFGRVDIVVNNAGGT